MMTRQERVGVRTEHHQLFQRLLQPWVCVECIRLKTSFSGRLICESGQKTVQSADGKPLHNSRDFTFDRK